MDQKLTGLHVGHRQWPAYELKYANLSERVAKGRSLLEFDNVDVWNLSFIVKNTDAQQQFIPSKGLLQYQSKKLFWFAMPTEMIWNQNSNKFIAKCRSRRVGSHYQIMKYQKEWRKIKCVIFKTLYCVVIIKHCEWTLWKPMKNTPIKWIRNH